MRREGRWWKPRTDDPPVSGAARRWPPMKLRPVLALVAVFCAPAAPAPLRSAAATGQKIDGRRHPRRWAVALAALAAAAISLATGAPAAEASWTGYNDALFNIGAGPSPFSPALR